MDTSDYGLTGQRKDDEHSAYTTVPFTFLCVQWLNYFKYRRFRSLAELYVVPLKHKAACLKMSSRESGEELPIKTLLQHKLVYYEAKLLAGNQSRSYCILVTKSTGSHDKTAISR